MVGEIRDRETADIAIRAALTGHFVYSTLHTNDAPSAITRLTDMQPNHLGPRARRGGGGSCREVGFTDYCPMRPGPGAGDFRRARLAAGPARPGANGLIRNGATLVQGVEDILEVLRPILAGGFREPDPEQEAILAEALEAEVDRIRVAVEEALGPAPVEIDELIRQLRVPAAAMLTVILGIGSGGANADKIRPGNVIESPVRATSVRRL